MFLTKHKQKKDAYELWREYIAPIDEMERIDLVDAKLLSEAWSTVDRKDPGVRKLLPELEQMIRMEASEKWGLGFDVHFCDENNSVSINSHDGSRIVIAGAE